MRNYLLRRLLVMVPMVLGISILTFAILQLSPGDPASLSVSLNSKIDPGYITKLRASYGLDQPVYVQYGHWLQGMLTLNFGNSFMDGRPVSTVIAERLPATLLLSGLSEVLLFLVAVPLGVMAAYYRGSWLDRFLTLFSFAGFAMPTFWLALMLMLIFGVHLGWLPVSGMTSVGSEYLPWYGRIGDLALHLILPLVVTTYGGLASVSRYARTSMLEVIRQDYIRTARAKGLSEFQVVFKHALPNALIPIITLLGLSLPALIGGSFIIETIFAWPGMGRLGFEAIMSRNYTLVMGIGTISAILTLLGNLLADIGYALADPRVRYE
ncbi:MAG TPA: ABC transporter permease [bacterium]|nr:ABC transporter permease [bacterium]